MLRVRDVALRLNISLSKAYELINQGRITHCRFEGAIRVAEDDLEDYIARCKKGRGPRSEERKRSPRPGTAFKHLDGDRLLAAWRRQGVGFDPPSADTLR
jgi:excisionase family DNA binding protein